MLFDVLLLQPDPLAPMSGAIQGGSDGVVSLVKSVVNVITIVIFVYAVYRMIYADAKTGIIIATSGMVLYAILMAIL